MLALVERVWGYDDRMGPDIMEKTRPDISHLKEQIDNSSPFIPCQPICTAGKILSGERVPGETGENPLLEESITLLFAPEIPTRIAAASALGILGDQQAIEPLFRTCMDDHAAVRDAARESSCPDRCKIPPENPKKAGPFRELLLYWGCPRFPEPVKRPGTGQSRRL